MVASGCPSARVTGKEGVRRAQPGGVGEGPSGDNLQREQNSLGCHPSLICYHRSSWSESSCSALFSWAVLPQQLDVCIHISVLV